MCGITGFFNNKINSLEEVCLNMLKALDHRGPDDFGIWKDECGLIFGHKRLSVFELSQFGHQPMHSHCGRYVIVFNGEVYNFRQIQSELIAKGYVHNFKGHSDTETILAAISFWGLKEAISKFIGMFAFALWDKKLKTLHLIRDRVGIKPLYYGYQRNSFIFASELSAFKLHLDFTNSINRDSLNLYFKYSYIPAPHTIYENIYKLEPGSIISFTYQDLINKKLPKLEYYWSAEEVYQKGNQNRFTGTLEEAIDTLEKLLRDSISLTMIADVPVGSFLSGGVDSSLITAIMQSMSSSKTKTFSIGFQEKAFNEANYAKAVARHLGTNHSEQYIFQKDIFGIIPDITGYMDEPIGDQSIFPTYFASKLAKNSVKVCLSGDGGDEIFFGYQKYYRATSSWNSIKKHNITLRKLLSNIINLFNSKTLDIIGFPLDLSLKTVFKNDSIGNKLHKLAELFSEEDFINFYKKYNSIYRIDKPFVLNSKIIPTKHLLINEALDEYQHMSLIDIYTFLSDGILTKVDRASMSISLETRVPMLDHRIIEFASTLPTTMKINENNGKHILKQLLYRYIPPAITDRPKKGFGMPVELWLKNELKDCFMDLTSSDKIKKQGYLDYNLINKMQNEFNDGKRNWNLMLWNILIFQSWLENNS